MKIYVKAKSKKELNERLGSIEKSNSNIRIYGDSHEMFNEGRHALDSTLPVGTVIAVYDRYAGGSPYAKAWGTWDGKRVK